MGVIDAIRRLLREELRSQIAGEAGAAGLAAPHWYLAVSNDLQALVDALGGCERIMSTRMPFGHYTMIQAFSFLWMFSFPLAISDEYAWFIAVPICTTLGFIVLKTDDMTERLSAPFGEGWHDLPLDLICVKIEAVLLEIAQRASMADSPQTNGANGC